MTTRVQVEVSGTVQGVGFRPFAYRVAKEEKISGWVKNQGGRVVLEIEATKEKISRFINRIKVEIPPPGQIEKLECRPLRLKNTRGFEILESSEGHHLLGHRFAHLGLSPDQAMCKECRIELMDPQNRRYLYPFITCTRCGPRYSIAERLPFDRNHTAMKAFEMCEQCQSEYLSPENSRFHSQTQSCES